MSVRVRPPAPTSKSAPLREECGRFSYARRACTSGHRKKTRTAPQAQGAFASARRGQCRKAFPPDTHAPSGFTHSPCLHERRHKKKDRAAPSAQGVFASAHRGRTPRVLHRTNIPTSRRACTSAGIRKKIEQRHRRKAFLRVPNGGARSACSTGGGSCPHCLRRRRRRVSTNEKETVRSTAAFASAERGRTLRVLHRGGIMPTLPTPQA